MLQKIITVAALVMLVTAGIARAEYIPPGSEGINNGSPVELRFCKEFQDSPSTGLANYTVIFRNTAATAATAIEVNVEFFDAFGTPVYTASLQKKGVFSPGVSVTALYSGLDAPPYSTVLCYVHRVLFADGSLWRGSLQNDATPTCCSRRWFMKA